MKLDPDVFLLNQIQQKMESVSGSLSEDADDSETIPKIKTSKRKTGFTNQEELAQRILKKVPALKQIEKVDIEKPTKEAPRIIHIQKPTSRVEEPVSEPEPIQPRADSLTDPLVPRKGEIIDIDVFDEPTEKTEPYIQEESEPLPISKPSSSVKCVKVSPL